MPFRTPPISPPQSSFLRGLRRVYSLDFRHRPMNSQDSGSADPLLGSGGSSRASERSSIPQSTIYNWSCGHFSKPLLSADDDNEENISRREEKEKLALDLITKSQHCSVNRLHNQIATWDTEFESGTRTALLHPFSPVVIAADESEWIRVWNYKEATLLNSFDNHGYPDKGISKICLVNELDESLLLVASSDGNIRIWKEYTARGQQKLVSAFSSLQGLRPGSHSVNAVVDWQQQSGYLFASGNISSIMAWDLDKEQLVNTSPIYSDCSISAIQSQLVRRDAAKQFSYHSQTLCPKWQFDYAVCSPLRQRSLFVQPDLIPKWKELLGLAFNLDFNQQRLSVHLRLVIFSSSI